MLTADTRQHCWTQRAVLDTPVSSVGHTSDQAASSVCAERRRVLREECKTHASAVLGTESSIRHTRQQ